MRFSWFLARRYLKPKRTAFSVITFLSIIGVMLAVGALIVVIGVMSGFDQQIRQGFLKMEPHIFINPESAVWDKFEAPPPPKERTAEAPSGDEVPPLPPPQPAEGEAPASGTEPTPTPTPATPSPDAPAPVPSPDEPKSEPAVAQESPEIPKAQPVDEKKVNPRRMIPKLESTDGTYGNWKSIIPEIKKHPSVESVHPYILMTSLLEADDDVNPEPLVAAFYAIDLENKDQVDKLKAMMVPPEEGGGAFDLGSDASGDKIILNLSLANRLGVGVGDKINAFSPENMKEIRKAWKRREAAGNDESARKAIDEEMDRLLVPGEFVIGGLFKSDPHPDFAVLSLEAGQILSGRKSEEWVSGLAVVTNNSFRADESLEEMYQGDHIPFGWRGDTWIGKHRIFFDAVQNERSMLYIILMIITVVAAFSTSISMIIFAVQKRREIGMIRSLGARTSQVLMVFTCQGMIVGLFGVALGIGGGFLVLHYRNPLRQFLANNFGIDIFPANIYQLPEIPAHLTGSDLLWICIPAFLLCSVAALLPALATCRQDPARSLRGER